MQTSTEPDVQGRVGVQTVAAVDLGSNSFHMVVGKLAQGQLQILDRLRERVALAEGLGKDRTLDESAQERALTCLERFGQRLRHLPPERVRAVGTNTLRNAHNARAFLRRARAALGHEIEVIEGREEARMIYNGVIHSRSAVAARTLVVDIGGGSTECILGKGNETRMTDSLQMGCLVYSARFFPGGQITKEGMRQAHLAAGLELEPIALSYRNHGWDACLGSSGTIRAISEIIAANGLGSDGIEPKGLRKLRKVLVAAKQVGHLDLAGLAADRAPVLPGGVAILSAVFKDLDIQSMHSSEGALREGLLIDLLGRIRHEDVRDATVASFMVRYNVDRSQAGRVDVTAQKLLGEAGKRWKLQDEDAAALMGWAARLHEIGLSVNYAGYHKHGAYLVGNAYMPGFSRDDQNALASLILAHRRKPSTATFESLPSKRASRALALGALLRLAVRLNRSRSPVALPDFGVEAGPRSVALTFPDGFWDQHPLTRADLEEEVQIWRGMGLELSFS
jgi:exopolyphosphatase/guanosine-5'-triphosphate,3'-diphosphate pyrophosphatase